jgi:hypothetical protein
MVVFGQWIDILDWPYGQIRPIFGPDNGLLKLVEPIIRQQKI